MKQINLMKRCDSHLLAHLYEHIYFMQLDTALRNRGFFDIVDYSIDAYTGNGEVRFDMEFYSDIDIDAIIHDASSEFLSIAEFLDIGLVQLECEYEKSLELQSLDMLKDQLLSFNDINWNDEIVYHADNHLLTIGEEIKTYEFRITSDYNRVETRLKPLYRQICGLTLNILLSDIADTHGGFVTSRAYATDQNQNPIGLMRLFAQLDKKLFEDMLAETKKELQDKQGYTHLCDMLRDMAKIENPPSAERTFQDTGVMMDEQKWRELAVEENLHAVLGLLHFDMT